MSKLVINELADQQRSFVLKSEDEKFSQSLYLPIGTSRNLLIALLQGLQEKDARENSYRFFIKDREVISSVSDVLQEEEISNEESAIEIVFVEEAAFRVRPVSRCTSSLAGHAEAVTSAAFSPDSRVLATGSGDTTIRFWDISTKTPFQNLAGHTHWVLCLAWSPDGQNIVSGDRSGKIAKWCAETCTKLGETKIGHKQWVNGISWEPYHVEPSCNRFVSCSKDSTAVIWNSRTMQRELTLAGHVKSVTCVKWSGSNLIYTASQDRTVKVWRATDGVLCRTLEGHGHWVNTLATSADWLLKIGPFHPLEDRTNIQNRNTQILQKNALERYNKLRDDGEKLVSGSDDNTMFLWKPENSKEPVARLTGHQQPVNDVKFSPDGRLFASASFDKSIKVWNSSNGQFFATLRGHVQAVYVIAWSADSRFLVSGSADSTLKVWDIPSKKLHSDLPGHADAVFAVDWSPDGSAVGSGGKDKLVRIWES